MSGTPEDILGELVSLLVMTPGSSSPPTMLPRSQGVRQTTARVPSSHAQSSCGGDGGACLVGVEELAAEPAVLVQVAAGHLKPPGL